MTLNKMQFRYFKKKEENIKYLNKSLQSHYLFVLVLSMIVPTVFVGGCLYYFIFTVMAEQIALPDVIAKTLLPVIFRINFILLIGLPIVFIIMLTWAIILSYRFVGPLERLEEDLERIDDGDYSVRINIRKDHDLSPVADVINDLVEKIEKHEKER